MNMSNHDRRNGAAVVIFIVIYLLPSITSTLRCTRMNGSSIVDHNKWFTLDVYPRVVVDCKSRGMTRVPKFDTNDVTELDLSKNNIATIYENDFVNMTELRILVLASSFVQALHDNCFSKLTRLEQLALHNNDIKTFQPAVFAGLHALRVLTLSGIHMTSYPTQFVPHTPELRVLSLSVIVNTTIAAEYTNLTRLEVLDFYEGSTSFVEITAAMFDNIRKSNISTLSFRRLGDLTHIQPGAFSNLPNVRSLVLSCNVELPYQNVMTSLAATMNTSVDTVVLDGSQGEAATFKSSDICSPFWRRVKRLSVQSAKLIAADFKHSSCLTNMQELNVNYNSLFGKIAYKENPFVYFSNLRKLSISHRSWQPYDFRRAFCQHRYYMLDVNHYFPIEPPVLSQTTVSTTNNTAPCSSPLLHIGAAQFPSSLEFLDLADFGLNFPEEIKGSLCINHVHLRFLNFSMNKFTNVLCSGCFVEGVNRVEVWDLSHGALELITPEFMHSFVNLRFLNLSHNALGDSGSDFQDSFSGLRLLEDINLSHNRLRVINPLAFKYCTRLKLINLANNELTDIHLNMDSLTDLEYIDLSGNRLTSLSDTFMSKLDEMGHDSPIAVDLQHEMFMCNCDSLSFVRWTRVTHVQLVSKERLKCTYGDIRDKPLSHTDLEAIESGCRVPFVLVIVVSIVAVLIFICLFAVLARYQRWYINYHRVLCWSRETTTTSSTQDKQYDAMVLYFMHSTNSREQQGGVARISRWVCTRLLPRAEKGWRLSLYVGDRDDVGGEAKIQNFMRGFNCSDKLVVCLTREFIQDIDCMHYLAIALDSNKPLNKYIFVLFDNIQPTSVPRRVGQLLLPNAPSVQITWSSVDDEDETAHKAFWRRMRAALKRNPERERGRRRFDVIPLLMSPGTQW